MIPCTFIFSIQLYPIPLYFVTMASMMLSTGLYFKKEKKENKNNTSTYAVYNEKIISRPPPDQPLTPLGHPLHQDHPVYLLRPQASEHPGPLETMVEAAPQMGSPVQLAPQVRHVPTPVG